MNIQHLTRRLHRENDTKIVLAVADGLGGLARELGGPTELEVAYTPNLGRLAKEGTCGLITLVLPGITCGSGPGHLALFGYDPLEYQIGRGALSALGIDFDLRPSDVAARGNFCTIGDDGEVIDRRAGRISHNEGMRLTEKLRQIQLRDVELFIEPVMQYRFAVGQVRGLSPDVLIVTGDHSTPSRLRGHSWHPVPVVLAAGTCRTDRTTCFGEGECANGGLGHIEGKYLMALALAHAGRLHKFGA